jgi:hypothetical protein
MQSLDSTSQGFQRFEQRATVRRRKLTPVQVVASDSKKKPIRGWVVDHSLGGFRLILPRRYALERVLRFRPADSDETVPWLSVQVKSCIKKDDHWELGCKLLSSPSYSTLLLFW